MGRNITTPSARLTAAAGIAAVALYDGEDTKNLIAIDVGCDHAKLAIYLVQSGICKHVFASDINEGPVMRAKENVSRRTLMGKPLSQYIDVVKADGLANLCDKGANRIFILGMGGEVISSILENAPLLRNDDKLGKIKFILQPMTSEDKLRRYLLSNGYNILEEKLVLDKARIYSVMSVCYDGVVRSYTPAELLLGKHNILLGGDLFKKNLERKIKIVTRALSERKESGIDCTEFESLLYEMMKIKEKTL